MPVAAHAVARSAKDAMRALVKRLSSSSSKPHQLLVTLKVRMQWPLSGCAHGGEQILECCVKNSGAEFHEQLLSADFLESIRKLVAPNSAQPKLVQQRTLELLQQLCDAQKGDAHFAPIQRLCDGLMQQGGWRRVCIETKMPATR